MKLFKRATMMTVFGAGFLLGSKQGTGPWEKAMAKFNEFQGNNPQVKEKVEQAKSQVNQMKSSVTGNESTGGSSTTGSASTTAGTESSRQNSMA